MRLTIRDMTPSDARAVAETRVRSWRCAYQGLVPQLVLDGMRPERFAAGLRGALSGREPRDTHLVADARGEGVIGWASFGPYRPVGELDGVPGAAQGAGWGELSALYVHPEFLGRGIGRALLATALDGLAERGHRRARVWVLSGSKRGRRFFEQAGFAPDGGDNVLTMADQPVPEVRYARPLDPPPAGAG